jgi:hypothetical protein
MEVSELNNNEHFQVKFIENYYSHVQVSNNAYSRIQTRQHMRASPATRKSAIAYE